VTRPRKWTRPIAVLALALAAQPALAEWQRLGEEGLVDRLSGALVAYEGVGWQSFLPTGRMIYRGDEAPSGNTSRGEWWARDDRLCSRWHPGGAWECYSVEVDGAGGIRFIDAYGNISAGRFLPDPAKDVGE
jgi:hypothetical protein